MKGRMTTEEKLDRLTNIVDSLASSVVHHDNQIEALIQIVDKQGEQIAKTERAVASLERQWQPV
jgi:flagellar biosynthesis chaperone FliJ